MPALVCKIVLFIIGQIQNVISYIFSQFFQNITTTTWDLQPLCIVFLAIFFEFYQLRMLTYVKHRFVVFVDILSNASYGEKGAKKIFGNVFATGLVFFKIIALMDLSKPANYIKILLLCMFGVAYMAIGPLVLLIIFSIIFMYQLTINILTLFVTQFIYPFPFIQNLFGITDNGQVFMQLNNLYSEPKKLAMVIVLTLLIYVVPILIIPETEATSYLLWGGIALILVGQYIEYLIYHRQSPAKACIVDFEQDPDFFGSYLQGTQSTGYCFIPYIGQILYLLSSILNSPPLAHQGERDITMNYFVNIIRFYCFISMTVLIIQQSWWFVPHLVVVTICALFDAYEDAKSIVPATRLLNFTDIKLTKKKDSYRPDKKDFCVLQSSVVVPQKPILMPKIKLP